MYFFLSTFSASTYYLFYCQGKRSYTMFILFQLHSMNNHGFIQNILLWKNGWSAFVRLSLRLESCSRKSAHLFRSSVLFELVFLIERLQLKRIWEQGGPLVFRGLYAACVQGGSALSDGDLQCNESVVVSGSVRGKPVQSWRQIFLQYSHRGAERAVCVGSVVGPLAGVQPHVSRCRFSVLKQLSSWKKSRPRHLCVFVCRWAAAEGRVCS